MKKIEVITRPEKLVGLKEIFATHNCQCAGENLYDVLIRYGMWTSERISAGDEFHRR